MKILVVSGFLGAGKTTFIKEMAQKQSRILSSWKMNTERSVSTKLF